MRSLGGAAAPVRRPLRRALIGTTAVGELGADAVGGTPLLAVTTATSVEPASPGATVYVDVVAPVPVALTQLLPLRSQRSHW